MKREEIGIWAEGCGFGQTDLIVFAFHLPALMEMILIGKSPCRGKCKPSQVENACISHFYFNKPLHLPYDDGKIIFSLLIELDVYKISTVKKQEKMMRENKMSPSKIPIHEGEVFSLERIHTNHTDQTI